MVYEQKLQFLELIQPFSYSKTDPDRQLAKLRYQSGITSANEEEIALVGTDANSMRGNTSYGDLDELHGCEAGPYSASGSYRRVRPSPVKILG